MAADFLSLHPTETLNEINGIWISAGELYVDDLVIAPAATKKVRHAAGEWTPGAANWPSGGLDFDDVAYNHYDHAGNLRAQSGKNGLTTGSAWVSDAFGDHATGGSDYQHTANHLDVDADAGLFYFNNRWFDAEIGRFTQRNTPFQPLAEHAYGISEGDAVNWVDRSGYRGREIGAGMLIVRPGTPHPVIHLPASEEDAKLDIMKNPESICTIGKSGDGGPASLHEITPNSDRDVIVRTDFIYLNDANGTIDWTQGSGSTSNDIDEQQILKVPNGSVVIVGPDPHDPNKNAIYFTERCSLYDQNSDDFWNNPRTSNVPWPYDGGRGRRPVDPRFPPRYKWSLN